MDDNNILLWTKEETMPSPFANIDGSVVTTTDEWESRREVVLGMLEYFVYDVRPDFESYNFV